MLLPHFSLLSTLQVIVTLSNFLCSIDVFRHSLSNTLPSLSVRNIVEGATAPSNKRHRSSLKLFVFGDSYADTGNWGEKDAPSWKEPYGMSFPGKPSGRFSDGRVLTDYIGMNFHEAKW